MTTLGAAPIRRLDESAGGRRKQDPVTPTPPLDLLTGYVLSIFLGDPLAETGRHAGARWRAIFGYVSYASLAAFGALWLWIHPGRANYRVIGAIPLGSSAGIAVIIAALTYLIAVERFDLLRKCVWWGRRAFTAFAYGTTALASISAACGIGAALYSAQVDGGHDTAVIRADAFGFAYLAVGLSLLAHGLAPRHRFSVIKGRPRTVAHLFAAASRVLMLVSLFVTIAELSVPGSTVWITVAATLLLTCIGWEIAQQPSADQALRRFAEGATAVQSAAARRDGDLLGPLTALENACSRYGFGRKLVVETEVAMLVRACLERIDPNERRSYHGRTVMADLQAALALLDDDAVRYEVVKFATALRQAVALQVPLFTGDIWSIPRPS